MVLAIRVGTVDYQEDSSALNLDHSTRRMRICDCGGGEVVGSRKWKLESSRASTGLEWRPKTVGSRYCTWLFSVRLKIKF
jgi:hypothetical protein